MLCGGHMDYKVVVLLGFLAIIVVLLGKIIMNDINIFITINKALDLLVDEDKIGEYTSAEIKSGILATLIFDKFDLDNGVDHMKILELIGRSGFEIFVDEDRMEPLMKKLKPSFDKPMLLIDMLTDKVNTYTDSWFERRAG